jgi:hypothetical protein
MRVRPTGRAVAVPAASTFAFHWRCECSSFAMAITRCLVHSWRVDSHDARHVGLRSAAGVHNTLPRISQVFFESKRAAQGKIIHAAKCFGIKHQARCRR